MNGQMADGDVAGQIELEAASIFIKKLANLKEVQPKIAEVEWNFQGCPTYQLAFCQTYEYGRSSSAMQKRVQRWRHEEFAGADDRITSNYQLNAVQPMDLFRLFPEFPQTPWLSFNPRIIKQRLAALPKRVPILVRSVPVDKMRDFGEYQNSVHILEAFQTTTIQPMEINWYFHDKNLIDAFKNWLKQNRPYRPNEGRGRTEPRVLLNALSAKRLLAHHSVPECQYITGTVLGESLFNSDSDWYDAKAKAETYLAGRLPAIPVEKFAKNVKLLFENGFTDDEVNQLWQYLVFLKVSDAKAELRPKGEEFVAAMCELLKKLHGK